MTPSSFPEATKDLMGGGIVDPFGKPVEGLPVWSDGQMCVSLWRMSWRERLSALVFGRVWLTVLYGSSQPPVSLTAARTYFVKADDQ